MKIKWAFVVSVTISCLLLLTVVLIMLHPTYFKISQTLAPHPHFHIEAQGDIYSNGNSKGYWVDEKNGSWACQFGDKLERPFCYYQVYLGNGKDTGLDLSRYNKIEFDVAYQGNIESIRLYMRNFNSAFSKGETDYNSTKYMRLDVDSRDFESTLIVNFDEFKVADWWLERYSLPRHLRFPSFDNVVLLGIQIETRTFNQHVQKMTVSNITIHGESISKEQLYFYIILVWATLISILVLFQFMRMLNIIRRREKSLSKLAKDNIQLSEQKQSFEQLSKIDPLTQLANRAGINSYIEQQKNSQHNFIVGLLDIDHFKKLNDVYGHDSGDEVLKQVSLILKESVRKDDCVGRWGGEEFILILPDISYSKAHKLADKLRLKVAETLFNLHHNNTQTAVNVTISIGLARAQNEREIAETIKTADSYLYQAKHKGRNRVEIQLD